MNRDGTVVVGKSIHSSGMQIASVWSGPNHSIRTDLDSLAGGLGARVAYVVSDDGAVVGGITQQDGFPGVFRAVVWHGNNWQDKTPLGTLKRDNTGTSYVYALNGDGSIAAGWAQSDTSTRRATIWYGHWLCTGRQWQYPPHCLVKGRAYSLTFGQNFGTPESKSFGWYAALRRTEAKRTAYQEDESLSFPFTYGEARLKDTALAVGTEGSLQLTDKLAWQGGLEVEQRLGGSETRFTASANHLGDYAEAHKPTGFRPNIRTALTYAFSPEAKLSLGGYLGRSAFTGTDKGVYLKLHGKF